MPGDEERAALEALGYSEEWLASGILGQELLAEQYARLQAGGTRKTGRYRTQAVSAWLEGSEPLDDGQLGAFLGLMAAEPDRKVARAGVAELIGSPRLSLEQLGRIATSDPKLMRSHESLIRRTYLGRRLAQEVSDELIAQVLELKDASLQTRLVRDPRLTRKQAERLAKSGANPQIRENAQAWFQDKSAWK